MNQPTDKYNFEQFLRESIEDFKMMPERKIWYGIYNQMHPAKRWPSMAISLVILTCIMFVGVSNNYTINTKVLAASSIQYKANKPTPTITNNVVAKVSNQIFDQPTSNPSSNIATAVLLIPKIPTSNIFINAEAIEASVNGKSTINKNNEGDELKQIAQNKVDYAVVAPKASITLPREVYNNIEHQNDEQQTELSKSANKQFVKNSKGHNNEQAHSLVISENDNNANKEETTSLPNNIEKQIALENVFSTNEQVQIVAKVDKKNIKVNEKLITTLDIEDKEKYTPAAKTVQGKIKQKGSLQYYLTPSYGYRTLSQKGKATNLASLKDDAALNIELGAALLYKVSKNTNVTIGLQANYTNYVSWVVDLGHTTPANLAVNNFAQSSMRTSTYATKVGNDRLNKTTWQIALPIGAHIKIVGNDKLSWNVGATLQPTYVLGGTGFVLSADNQNYIAEKTLMRKLNLNTAAETFLSVRTASGINFVLGPQVRYQLLSTFKNTYNHSEKLYNFGFKIGVVTKL